MKLPQKILERKYLKNGYDWVIGVDEVGTGCLAGPVVVCAASFNKEFFQKTHRQLHEVRDSKLLSFEQREKLTSELLKEKNLCFQIAYCYPKTIDKLNIYQAARRAMKRAITRVTLANCKGDPCNGPCNVMVLIDGLYKIAGLKLDQQAIVKGDRRVFTIACASILAKVFRDKMMIRYAKKFPGYGFEKHKGYGTKEHLAKLVELGSCAIHRFSFAPVKKYNKIVA